MSIRSSLEETIATLTAALPDADKVDSKARGAAAAGTRVRKAAQAGKTALHDLRKDVSDALGGEETE